MSKRFESCLSEQLEAFVEMKINIGRKYRTGISYLRTIDKAAIRFRLAGARITRKFSDSLLKLKPNDSKMTRYDRVRQLRQFSIFLDDQGIQSYIPTLPKYPGGASREFIPHIYTPDEVRSILTATDNLVASGFAQGKTPIFGMPAYIRLVIATGLRACEAVNLKTEEINFERRTILIKDSKNGRERLLPISKSLCKVLSYHLESMNLFCQRRAKSPFFFITVSGSRIKLGGIRKHFRTILESAGIPFRGKKHGPRIHDFRHTFAVRALEKMVKAGLDSYTALPIIQTYLGHLDIKSTDHYLRLTEDFQAQIARKIDKSTFDVYPKLKVK